MLRRGIPTGVVAPRSHMPIVLPRDVLVRHVAILGATPDWHDRLRAGLLILLTVAVPLWGCGAKGPPLAPLVVVPERVSDVEVRRLGDEVYVAFTLPTENRDGSEPADLVRVDVYAMTTQPRLPLDRTLGREEFEEAATLIASIAVRPRATSSAATVAEPAGEAPVDPASQQGSPVVIAETLVASTRVAVDPWEDERDDEEDDDDEQAPEGPLVVPLTTPPLPGSLQREYVVVGVSSKGNEVEATSRIAVPLVAPPVPPSAFAVTYTEEAIDVTWELPAGVRATVQMPATSNAESAADTTSPGSVTGASATAALSVTIPADPALSIAAGPEATGTLAPPRASSRQVARPIVEESDASPVLLSRPIFERPVPPSILPSRPIIEWPPASRYDLYEIVEVPEGTTSLPSPLNAMPLATPAYADRSVELGIERCYAVSTLDVVGGLEVRSHVSAEACVTLVDVFPPAAPEGLRAVGTDGAVGLIWQPNDEDDLAGYLVLRGVPPGDTLQPLTREPVPENTYRDTTAVPGVRYVYAVRAVDTVAPPNVSPPSNQAESGAR